MKRGMAKATLLTAIVAVGSLVTAWEAEGQRWRRGRNLSPPIPPQLEEFPDKEFSFCTIEYVQVRDEALGFGWSTDFPDSGYNFMLRLEELTNIRIARERNGEPKQVVLKLTDDALFNYPYIFMSDVGTASFSQAEIENLREYLLRGGFLHVDDFWGTAAWNHWESLIRTVLPPDGDRFRIEDIPLTDDIFHIVFHVTEVPQVPSIQWWNQVRQNSTITSERGDDSREPHFRGIRHPDTGRLMVVMTHNTDIADGWEKERENEEFFREFSVKKSYPLGINIVVYAMTH